MILAECPVCHKKQATKNKVCGGKSGCGEDLVKAKRSTRVRYWIKYRLPGGTQRKEYVGMSIEEARDADGKRRSQKRENRIFDIEPEAKMTFQALSKWFLSLERVKAFASYDRYKHSFDNFKSEFGNVLVRDIKKSQIENYQQKRLAEGKAKATVDREIGDVKQMINDAYKDRLVGAHIVMTFSEVKKLLKKNENARDVILPADKFENLLLHSPQHLIGILATGFYTGMRKGEILSLTWDMVDLDRRFIRLEADNTKDKEARALPICDELHEILKRQPKGDERKAVSFFYVFTFNGKAIRSNFKRSLVKACEDAGIPYGRIIPGGFTFHDLRHTFNTYMRKAGVAESVIMKITGHSTREMFDRYNTIDADDAKSAMELFRGYISSASGPQNGPQEAEKG